MGGHRQRVIESHVVDQRARLAATGVLGDGHEDAATRHRRGEGAGRTGKKRQKSGGFSSVGGALGVTGNLIDLKIHPLAHTPPSPRIILGPALQRVCMSQVANLNRTDLWRREGLVVLSAGASYGLRVGAVRRWPSGFKTRSSFWRHARGDHMQFKHSMTAAAVFAVLGFAGQAMAQDAEAGRRASRNAAPAIRSAKPPRTASARTSTA